MRIVIADDGDPFDSTLAGERPLRGAELCLVRLAEAFAAAGHEVLCLTRCRHPLLRNGVRWIPLHDVPLWKTLPVDLFIVARGGRALDLAARWGGAVGRLVLWSLTGPQVSLPLLWRLWRRRPLLVFVSQAQARACPVWVPGPRRVIPHGVAPLFVPHRQDPPPPRAAFLSDPRRGLADLLDLWEQRVLPRLPGAELHVFTGSAIMGRGDADLPETAGLLARAGQTAGVVLHGAVPQKPLAGELAGLRAFCYPATVEEAFCLPAAETQALGLPGVVMARGALPERVQNGVTGFVTPAGNAAAFAEALIAVLEKNVLWSHLHRATCEQPVRRWPEVAAEFLALVEQPVTARPAMTGPLPPSAHRLSADGVAAGAE